MLLVKAHRLNLNPDWVQSLNQVQHHPAHRKPNQFFSLTKKSNASHWELTVHQINSGKRHTTTYTLTLNTWKEGPRLKATTTVIIVKQRLKLQGRLTGQQHFPNTVELQQTPPPHHHRPTWQRHGWQLIITPKGGIADEFASIRMWRSKRCCPAACGETPTAQQALLFHHGADRSSLDRGQGWRGSGKESQR